MYFYNSKSVAKNIKYDICLGQLQHGMVPANGELYPAKLAVC